MNENYNKILFLLNIMCNCQTYSSRLDSNNDNENDLYDNIDNNDIDDNNDDNINDDDNSIYDYDDLYEPDEKSHTKYNIILCELYNKNIHGQPISNSNVEKHYLINCRFKTLNTQILYDLAQFINSGYSCLNIKEKQHNIFKNYKNIISKKDYIKPEIAECIYLNTEEYVAILKTFWIRLIQRTWKKIYKERQSITKKRFQQKSLRYREILGRWPDDCCYLPNIKGMLHYLKYY